MPVELGQLASGLPFAASFVAAGAAGVLWIGRRRSALNEALHELRRPLQALALAIPEPELHAGTESSLRLAAAALERLEREINGPAFADGGAGGEPIRLRTLTEAAIGRWRMSAARLGCSLALHWEAADPWVAGSRPALEQALDNLITNALQHGGRAVAVRVREAEGQVRLAVRDPGRSASAAAGGRPRAGLAARLLGRSRHGHGLRVVRRTAAAHRGDFVLRRSAAGTEAALILPALPPAR